MSIATRGVRFWVVSVATLLAVLLTGSLGQWQLRRAAQKEALQQAVDSQAVLPQVVNADLAAGDPAALVQRRTSLRGIWQPARTVYLDNRPMDGKTGFIVVTPLLLEGGEAIVVQRGWVQRDFSDRTRLPAIATPAGTVVVEGRIAPPPSKLYEFKGAEAGPIRQNLDIAAFRTETGLQLLEISLLQTGAASEGLLRDWPAPNLGIDRHYGYAFQWFGLAALLVILYAWFQIIVPLRTKRP
jgi:surfeit locus 1 family protein